MNLKTGFILQLLISVPLIAHGATYYKSIDDQGNVQYTQIKPKEVETERIKVNARTPENSSTYKRPSLNSASKETEGSAGSPENNPEPEQQLSSKQKKKACAEARATFAKLNSSGQIRQRDAKGKTRYLTDKEKQARIKNTRRLINEHCK